MKARKFLLVVSLVLLMAITFTACGAKPEEDVLNVWITWGDNPAQLQALFDRYGEANGVKVVVSAPVEEDQILPALTGSAPPDVLILSGGDLVKSYAQEGLVVELSEAIDTGGIDLADIYDAPLAQCKQGDDIWCLPWGADIYALFWNKDAFEAAGLDPESPPTTMEELEAYAEQLTVVGDDGTIEQIGFIPDQAWSHSDLYVRLFGGFWYSDDGTQLAVNSQPMIDMLLWQQQFYDKYGYDEVLAFSTGFGDQYMSPDYPFYTGKLAMYVDGEWQTGPNFISALKPELNYGVAPFPYPADHPERANTGVVQGTVAVIPANVKDPEASAKLLAWIMSPEVVAEEMCVNANLPTSKKAAQDPCFMENPKFKVFVDLMGSPNASYIITTPLSLELNDAYGLVEEQVLHTGADPVPLLNQLQEEFAPKLAEALK
ncbi:MAG: extracellular solute-binding protein [Anaerolineae bacterium]|nr:extracellular solute-binding protein [Anaerolineae bacterium]